MELIDRQALMDALYEKEYSTLCPLDEVSGVVDSIPTVDAAPVVHGRWEMTDYAYTWKCSECGGTYYSSWANYCPHCGAKMDGGAEDGC